MEFRDKEYYRASLERMQQARLLYNSGSAFALAIYGGGLAVECLLRAFRWREDRSFEGRHDLNELLTASRILRVDEDRMRRRGNDEESIRKASIAFRADLNGVVALWHNNLRFASETRLKAYLTQLKKVQGIKGDPLKKNAADLVNSAQRIIDRGVVLWNSQTKS
jgi:hypothetical protein